MTEPVHDSQTCPAGSLADMVAPSATVGFAEAFPSATVIKVAILAALLVGLNYSLLRVMVLKWLETGGNWTHCAIIPLFSLYLLYARREELFTCPRRPAITGLAIMMLALAIELPWVMFRLPGTFYVAQNMMLLSVFGLVLYLAGWKMMRLAWLPILYLFFAIPVPDLAYARVAVPLQGLSAKGAVAILHVLQVDIRSTASNLELITRSGARTSLTVAEACSGMRMLMAFVALGVAMAYLDYKPIWQRAVLVAAAVPIAIFCNVIRVTITCWMYYIDKPELGQKFMHFFLGILMLVPAFLLLWLLAWIMANLFIEDKAALKEAKA